MLNEQADISSWYYHDQPTLEEGDELDVRREPNNEYDDMAVALYKGNKKVGYVPRELTEKVNSSIESGSYIDAIVMWPYQEELNMVPRVHLMDAEARMKERADRESAEKRGKNQGMAIAIGFGLLVCVVLGVLLGLIM